ncbi:MAG: hypothetical protein P9X27_06785, partial [Candidatus Kaelpia aquatica]|nr:hypothetical protein [Candidatus Kaelpia aquatica]
GKLVENMEVAEVLQRDLANRNELSEDIIVASLLNLGFSRTDTDALLEYMRSANPPQIDGEVDLPQTLLHLLEGTVDDFLQDTARQVRWDQGDIYNFLFNCTLGSLNQEGQWMKQPIPGHLKWHMFMNVVGLSLDTALPAFIATWWISEFLPTVTVAIESVPLMLSHFALTMGSLYYMFHQPKAGIVGTNVALSDMTRSQSLLMNIVERTPLAIKNFYGAFRGQKIEWNVYGQAAAGRTNQQMIGRLKKSWIIGSAAALTMGVFSPSIWPIAFGSLLLGSLIASPFLAHTMGRPAEGIQEAITAVRAMDDNYAKVLDTIQTVDYPNGLENRLVQLASGWNKKRIVYETEYNRVPSEYQVGEEESVFMDDVWSMLTEREQQGLTEVFGTEEAKKTAFFDTIAQIVIQQAKSSEGYDVYRTALDNVTSSNPEYKDLNKALTALKGEKAMPLFVKAMAELDVAPWETLSNQEKDAVRTCFGGDPLSMAAQSYNEEESEAAVLYNSFVAEIRTERDAEILRRADTAITACGLEDKISEFTEAVMRVDTTLIGVDLTEQDAREYVRRIIYSMYLDGIHDNIEQEFYKVIEFSDQIVGPQLSYEQSNPDITLAEQIQHLNDLLMGLPH